MKKMPYFQRKSFSTRPSPFTAESVINRKSHASKSEEITGILTRFVSRRCLRRGGPGGQVQQIISERCISHLCARSRVVGRLFGSRFRRIAGGGGRVGQLRGSAIKHDFHDLVKRNFFKLLFGGKSKKFFYITLKKNINFFNKKKI